MSSGILIPLYDPDTNMVILAGKGDRYMQFVEVRVIGEDRDGVMVIMVIMVIMVMVMVIMVMGEDLDEVNTR